MMLHNDNVRKLRSPLGLAILDEEQSSTALLYRVLQFLLFLVEYSLFDFIAGNFKYDAFNIMYGVQCMGLSGHFRFTFYEIRRCNVITHRNSDAENVTKQQEKQQGKQSSIKPTALQP